MTQQKPRTKPEAAEGELGEAALASITGGTDQPPPAPTQTQSNLLKKIGDTSSGIAANIK